jgi:hypothetical protein
MDECQRYIAIRSITPVVASVRSIFAPPNAASNVSTSSILNVHTYMHVRVRSHDWPVPQIPAGSAPRGLLDDSQAPGLEGRRDAHYTFCWGPFRPSERCRSLLSSSLYYHRDCDARTAGWTILS